MIDREPFSSTTKPAHNFIGNQQNVIFPGDLAQPGPIILWRNQNSVRPGDPFHDKSCDCFWPFVLDDLFDMGDALPMTGLTCVTKDTAVTIWIKNMDDSRNSRFNGRSPVVTAQSDRPIRRPMVGDIAGNNFMFARVQARKLNRVFIGLGTPEGELPQ